MRQAGDLCGGTKEAEAAASAREAHAAHEAVRAEAAKAAARAEAGGAIETVAAHAEAARTEAGEAAEVQGQLHATSMARPVEVKRVLVDFRVNLAVSADDYGEAVLAGANFDEVNGVFFMPPRVDLLPVSEWLPFNLDGRTNSSRHRPSLLPEPPVPVSVLFATQMRAIAASFATKLAWILAVLTHTLLHTKVESVGMVVYQRCSCTRCSTCLRSKVMWTWTIAMSLSSKWRPRRQMCSTTPLREMLWPQGW